MKVDRLNSRVSSNDGFKGAEETGRLLSSFGGPLSIIKAAATLGVKGWVATTLVSLIFLCINIILVAYTLVLALYNHKTFYGPLVSLVVAVGFSIWVFRKTYGYVFIKVVETIYNQTQPMLQTACGSVIGQLADKLQSSTTGQPLVKSQVEVIQIFEKGFSGIPRFAKKISMFLLRRIPLVRLVQNDITPILIKGDREEAARVLFGKFDLFIRKGIFASNSLLWVLWMLPLNIIIGLLVILILV